MNAKHLLILSAISLSGCSIFGVDPIQTETVQQERVKLELQDPAPLALNDIEWYIITPENQAEILSDLSKNYDPVLYGLTDEDYQDISENMVKLRNYIIEQRNIIKAYKEYYEKL